MTTPAGPATMGTIRVDRPPPLPQEPFDPMARQRAVLAVLVARRTVVGREIARLEARRTELDRAVDGLARALAPPGDAAGRRGVSTDGGLRAAS